MDVGGIGQSFLNSNRFLNIDPALHHGVPAWVGIFSSGGGLLLDELPWEGFPFSEFIVVLGAVVDDWMIMLLTLGVDLGLATTCTLYLYVGLCFLLLLVAFASLLTRGLVLGWMGLDWFCWDWILDPTPLLFEMGSHFLDKSGVGWSLVLQGLHLIIWHILSLLNMWIPCMDVIFTWTSTVSTGKRHLKNPCKKLHLGCRMHAICKSQYSEVYLKLHILKLCLPSLLCACC